jgi:uncharacterized protein YuzE
MRERRVDPVVFQTTDALGSAVKLNYDTTADTLYVSLGEPREASCVEPEEGILLRVDPDSGELVGLTILHFRHRLQTTGDHLANNIPLLPAGLMPTVIREWRLQQAA